MNTVDEGLAGYFCCCRALTTLIGTASREPLIRRLNVHRTLSSTRPRHVYEKKNFGRLMIDIVPKQPHCNLGAASIR